MTKIKFKNRIIAGLLIIVTLTPNFLLFSILPKKAEASAHDTTAVFGTWINTTIKNTFDITTDVGKIVEEIGGMLIRMYWRRLLAEITKSTINWIKKGHEGKPSFLADSRLFRDVQAETMDSFTNLIGRDSFKFPYGTKHALRLLDSYKEEFADRAAYSLSRVTQDERLKKRFRADFSLGGWNGFLLHTQFPQNNPIGFELKTTNELARQLQGIYKSKGDKIREKLNQADGFLNQEVCKDLDYDPSLKNKGFHGKEFHMRNQNTGESDEDYKKVSENYSKSYYKEFQEESIEFDRKANCTAGFQAVTPGGYISHLGKQALQKNFDQTTLAGQMGGDALDTVAAILDAEMSRWMDKGITSLQKEISDEPLPGEITSGSVSGTVSYDSDGRPSFVATEYNQLSAQLTVGLKIIEKDGVTTSFSDFKFFVENNEVQLGVPALYGPGEYGVRADTPAGYVITLGGDCDEFGKVKLNLKDSKTCVVTARNTEAPVITLKIKKPQLKTNNKLIEDEIRNDFKKEKFEEIKSELISKENQLSRELRNKATTEDNIEINKIVLTQSLAPATVPETVDALGIILTAKSDEIKIVRAQITAKEQELVGLNKDLKAAAEAAETVKIKAQITAKEQELVDLKTQKDIKEELRKTITKEIGYIEKLVRHNATIEKLSNDIKDLGGEEETLKVKITKQINLAEARVEAEWGKNEDGKRKKIQEMNALINKMLKENNKDFDKLAYKVLVDNFPVTLGAEELYSVGKHTIRVSTPDNYCVIYDPDINNNSNINSTNADIDNCSKDLEKQEGTFDIIFDINNKAQNNKIYELGFQNRPVTNRPKLTLENIINLKGTFILPEDIQLKINLIKADNTPDSDIKLLSGIQRKELGEGVYKLTVTTPEGYRAKIKGNCVSNIEENLVYDEESPNANKHIGTLNIDLFTFYEKNCKITPYARADFIFPSIKVYLTGDISPKPSVGIIKLFKEKNNRGEEIGDFKPDTRRKASIIDKKSFYLDPGEYRLYSSAGERYETIFTGASCDGNRSQLSISAIGPENGLYVCLINYNPKPPKAKILVEEIYEGTKRKADFYFLEYIDNTRVSHNDVGKRTYKGQLDFKSMKKELNALNDYDSNNEDGQDRDHKYVYEIIPKSFPSAEYTRFELSHDCDGTQRIQLWGDHGDELVGDYQTLKERTEKDASFEDASSEDASSKDPSFYGRIYGKRAEFLAQSGIDKEVIDSLENGTSKLGAIKPMDWETYYCTIVYFKGPPVQ
jgi:hypothetical protein